MATPAVARSQEVDEKQNEIPPLPPSGGIVTDRALYYTQIAQLRNTLAFGGQKNPSAIWTSMVRDDSSSIIYYRELEEKDEDVANAIDTLKLSVLDRDRSVSPADDSPQALEVAEFIEDQLEAIENFHAVLDTMLDAPGYGFSVSEIMYDVSEGQVALLDIQDCPQELFLFGKRFYPQVGPLQLLDTPYAMTGTDVPEEKFAIFSYRGRARNRMGRPLLRSVFWPSWFKRNVESLWLQYCEKGPGTVVARYPDSDNASEKSQAAEIAYAITANAAIAVPQNFAYDKELLTVARSLNPDVYEHLFEKMQYAIVRRILGETLTAFGGESGKGTQALGKVHGDTLDSRSIELCRALESVVNRQIVRPLVLWNFGPQAPMPKWGFDLAEEEDLGKRAIIDGALQGMGYPITKNYVAKRYDMPIPEADDEVLTPTRQAPAAPPTDPGEAKFSEDARVLIEGDLKQFDDLVDQLKKQSLSDYHERVKEVVDAAKPQGR